MAKSRRWLVPLGAAALMLTAATPAMAGGIIDPGPIGPNQFFTAQVNGASGVSRIAVTCDGGTDIVPTGHPVAGQTVNVVPDVFTSTGPAPSIGFTGSAGKGVAVALNADAGNKPQTVLRFYHVAAAIPTDLVVPCSGTGLVSFAPTPASTNARGAVVKVTFVTKP